MQSSGYGKQGTMYPGTRSKLGRITTKFKNWLRPDSKDESIYYKGVHKDFTTTERSQSKRILKRGGVSKHPDFRNTPPPRTILEPNSNNYNEFIGNSDYNIDRNVLPGGKTDAYLYYSAAEKDRLSKGIKH